MKMRSFGISAISILMTAAVIGNAYYQKKQFYPSVVYITKSNASMAVIYIQFFVIVLMLGKLLRKIFLGTLRAAEFEHLMERFWYALTETCLAFTVFRDDFNPRFVALFTVLLFLKSFHWLAEERVDYMERSPIISWLFHIRVASLLFVLGVLDYLMIMHAYNQTIMKGPTVQLVFGFEYAILITMIANITIKYVLHAAEMRSDTPWENKAVFLLYTELIIGLIKVILYLLFVVIMAKIYALPMFVFRPMFYTIRNFKKALNDVIMSRRAIRNMNTLYPDATPEELAMSDNICIICREDMISNSKKLPCGHIFHTACLRSWFQRQQTCPTCRLNILRTAHNSSVQRPDQVINQAVNQNNLDNQQSSVFNINNNNNNSNNNNNNIPNENPFTNLLNQMNSVNGIGNNANNNTSNSSVTSVPLIFPPLSPPSLSFPFIAAPYAIPPPPMPPGLDTLTDEEIRLLEGNERRHVEERIKLLRNIQLLLDASVSLMNQYSAVTARLPAFPTVATTATPVTTATVVTPSSSSSAAAAAVAMSQLSSTKEQQPKTSSSSSLLNSGSSGAPTSFLLKPELISSTSTGTTITTTNAKVNSIKSNKFDNNNLTDNKKIENQIHIEDIGSEEDENIQKNIKNYDDDDDDYVTKITSKNDSKQFTTSTTEIFSDNSESAELSELRRRRLQKFLQQERNDNINNN